MISHHNAHPILEGDLPTSPAEWTIGAACAETDPELWYLDKGGNPLPAKRICRGCPIRTECLARALQRNEQFGIWGGLTTTERHQLLRRRRAA